MRQEEQSNLPVRREEQTALTAAQSGAPKKSFWATNHKRLTASWRVTLVVLAGFLVVYCLLYYRSFSSDNLYYFGRDIANLPNLVGGADQPLYFDAGGDGSSVYSYRGGVAVVGREKTKVFAGGGECLLTVEYGAAYEHPAAALSRDYLVIFDRGGIGFSVINAYAVLYEGEAKAPILGVSVSDAGSFTVITSSMAHLSEVWLYDADFRLPRSFGRASATVAAPISSDGRTVAIVGATATGTVVDLFVMGEQTPLSSLTLEGFPYRAAFTSSGTLAVVSDAGLYTVNSRGVLASSTSFEGASPIAVALGDDGFAVALEVNRPNRIVRVLAFDRAGSVTLDQTRTGKTVLGLALSRECAFLLFDQSAECVRLKNGEVISSMALPDGALGITAEGGRTASILFPAMALTLRGE